VCNRVWVRIIACNEKDKQGEVMRREKGNEGEDGGRRWREGMRDGKYSNDDK
jgi:hypothetical protein